MADRKNPHTATGWEVTPLLGYEGGGRSGIVVSQGRPVAIVLMVPLALQLVV